MNKQLIMNKPLLDGFPIYGDFFSILDVDERVKPWLFNNFIQLRYLMNDKVVFFERYRSILDNCPFISHHSLSKEMVQSIWKKNIVGCFIQFLNLDCYIFLYADRCYIPESKQFQTEHFVHELFIYGYDDTTKKFYCKDNIRNGKYTSFECDFSQIENAYWNLPLNPYFTDVHFLKKIEKPYVNIKFDINYIVKLTKEYAYSLDSTNCFEIFTVLKYGFNIHKQILDNLRCIKPEENSMIDLRPIHIFYEHKIMMLHRMRFMKQLYHVECLDEAIEDYQNLADNYLVLRNVIMKYNKFFDEKVYQRIIARLYEAITYEEIRLDKLVHIFENLAKSYGE